MSERFVRNLQDSNGSKTAMAQIILFCNGCSRSEGDDSRSKKEAANKLAAVNLHKADAQPEDMFSCI